MVETWWSDERKALLRTLWGDGAPIEAIAQRLGTTRSAVAGQARRLKLVHRNGPKAASPDAHAALSKALAKSKRKKRSGPKAAELIAKADKFSRAFEALHAKMALRDAGRTPVALVDLEFGDCKWPIKTGFCGHKAIKGLPYCGPHAKRAFPKMAAGVVTTPQRLAREPVQLMLDMDLPLVRKPVAVA
jgi:GcrA cell cycle regulator